MTTVLLIVHLLVASALVAVILMQRSEGGALGIGGGGPGGMMSGRGAANLMTRLTMILGAIFVANSVLLAIVSGIDSTGRSVFDEERIEQDGDSIEGLFGDAFSGSGSETGDEDVPQFPAEDSPAGEAPEVPGDVPAEDPSAETEEPAVPGDR
jgi:preprotein translocase subunit SecG